MRCYEHATRRHGRTPDRYFSIRYYGSDGKRVEEAIGWASEGWSAEQAADIRSAIRKNIRTGQGPQTLTAMRSEAQRIREDEAQAKAAAALQDMSFEQLGRLYLEWAKANKPRSAMTDGYNLAHAFGELGAFPAKEINSARIETLKNKFMASHAPATVRHILGMIRRVYTWAAVTPRSASDATPLFTGIPPTHGVVVPRQDNRRLRFLSRDEAERLLTAAVGYPHRTGGMDFHDVCLLSLHCGLRKTEILELRWGHVDLTHGLLYVIDGKNTENAGLPVNELAGEMLARRLATRGASELVFPPLRGGTIRRHISHNFTYLADSLGLNDGVTDRRQKVVFHSLRHTFASWLALDGVDIYRIKELMRHKDLTQTQRYAHLMPSDARAAVERLCRR
ncbi:tyrosine-type recombinase/integrase [Solidesulfovibrio sp.]